MARPVTLTTGQWADLTLAQLAPKAKSLGFDGLELATWGELFEVKRAVSESDYCAKRREILEKAGLGCWALQAHLVGQCVLDKVDERHRGFCPDYVWGDGNPEGVSKRAAEEMKNVARAAQKMGCNVVTGFTGSSIWSYLYSFPSVPQSWIDGGYKLLAERWNPILDVFGECGVKFALEVHPTEIAFDYYSTEVALDVLKWRPEFGFNFDPSHLLWQGVDPVEFIYRFGSKDPAKNRIYHVHMKDAIVTLNGRTGILSSHLNFGDYRRGWDFRSIGHGGVNFEEIIRALNHIEYTGPLSVEWEDMGMEREFGASESCDYVKKINFSPSNVAFDGAFDKENR